MKASIEIIIALAFSAVFSAGCSDLQESPWGDPIGNPVSVSLDEVAEILAMIPMDHTQLVEVHHAVASSSENGYDEEYTMKNLFTCPGSGVGDSETKVQYAYDKPLRDLIEDYVYS